VLQAGEAAVAVVTETLMVSVWKAAVTVRLALQGVMPCLQHMVFLQTKIRELWTQTTHLADRTFSLQRKQGLIFLVLLIHDLSVMLAATTRALQTQVAFAEEVSLEQAEGTRGALSQRRAWPQSGLKKRRAAKT